MKTKGPIKRKIPTSGEPYQDFITTGNWKASERNRTLAEVNCKCGKKIYKSYASLISGQTRGNCGCIRSKNTRSVTKYKVGYPIGKLVITKRIKNSSMIELICECGKKVTKSLSTLAIWEKKDITKSVSCGCIKLERKGLYKVKGVPNLVRKEYEHFLVKNKIKYYFSTFIIDNRIVYVKNGRLFYEDNNMDIITDHFNKQKLIEKKEYEKLWAYSN